MRNAQCAIMECPRFVTRFTDCRVDIVRCVMHKFDRYPKSLPLWGNCSAASSQVPRKGRMRSLPTKPLMQAKYFHFVVQTYDSTGGLMLGGEAVRRLWV